MEENLESNNEIKSEIPNEKNEPTSEEIGAPKSEKIVNQIKDLSINENNTNPKDNSVSKIDKSKDDNPKKEISKPKKEIPIEKKPFQEFINIHLIPALKEEIKQRGLEINDINLKNTYRPIAGDKCWVINCEIKETCNFWLSFEKEDISSLKSISLSKPNQKPSIIESFLIDEKRITLKLIISRVLQRLNGQKLIGVN
tara:strand:- start:49 stop:642 length:594 start_codon:yes stop_codon:yes gene_type:complete